LETGDAGGEHELYLCIKFPEQCKPQTALQTTNHKLQTAKPNNKQQTKMDAIEYERLKLRWDDLCRKLGDQFGEEPDLQAILFLIGVQELGRGPQKYSKDEKQDLMHIAVCRLLSTYGYYQLTGQDQDGWPHWELVKKLPPLTLKEQDWLLKQGAVEYFDS
jgi:hypothetical protein